MLKVSVVFLLLVLALASSSPAAPAPPEPVIDHQEIVVALHPSDHHLAGTSSITIPAGTAHVTLTLTPSAHIESVTASGEKIPYTFSQGTLLLDTSHLPGTGAVTATVVYDAFFNDPLPSDSRSGEDPTYGVVGTITLRGTFLSAAAGWYPSPLSSPRVRTVRVSAPAGTEAVTAGKRVSRGTAGAVTSSVWEESHPVDPPALSAGPYLIEERRLDGIDLYTYFYPDSASLAPRYLDAAARYITLYRDMFGPYPYEKFAVVENFFPTGYGFPSLTLLGSTVIRLPFIVDTSFPHEIAHSWWGNAVQPGQEGGNWSEGLVTYLADYLLKEQRSPVEGRTYRLQLLSEFATLVPPAQDFPLARFSSRVDPPSRAIGYGKGAMVFHMIRGEIGDKAFFGALRDLCRERLHRSTSWQDFERAFSRSSGRNLSRFFDQWLTGTGGPHLALSSVIRQREGTGWLVSGVITQTGPVYELHLPLRVLTDAAPVNERLQVTGRSTPFRIVTAAEPRQLLLDPDAELFRVLASDELPATVNSIKSSRQLIGIQTAGCRLTDDSFKRFLGSLGQESARILNENDFRAANAGNYDLLICGIPKQPSLLPPLPAGTTVTDGQLTVQERTATSPDGLLFLTMKSPGSSGGITALLLPLSEAAAEKYLPKITHYGTFGSLLFSGGGIRSKGAVSPVSGRSVITFHSEQVEKRK